MKIKSAVKRGKHGINQKSNVNKREQFLNNELKRVGKSGGIIDNRIGAKDASKSEDEKAIRRHIIEKMRQISKFTMEEGDDDDPLIKAAFGSGRKSFNDPNDDNAEGGISADVVNDEFFAGGLLKQSRDHDGSSVTNFKDSLADKIAQTRLERLKRIEENDEQRTKLKNVNIEWTNKIRFMLAGIPIPTNKSSDVVDKIKEKRLEVIKLLDAFSTGKRIIPSGMIIQTEDDLQKKLTNLEEVISKNKTTGTEVIKPNAYNEKNELNLFRVLLDMPGKASTTISFLINKLEKAEMKSINELIYYLAIAQLVLDYLSGRTMKKTGQEDISNICAESIVPPGFFSPELVYFLTRVLQSTFKKSQNKEPGDQSAGLLYIKENVSVIEESAYATINIKFADLLVPLPPRDELSVLRLACLRRIIVLSTDTCRLYAPPRLPSYVVARLFAPMASVLRQLIMSVSVSKTVSLQQVLSRWPPALVAEANALLAYIDGLLELAPPPEPLKMQNKLVALRMLSEGGDVGGSCNSSLNRKALKKLGVLEQLEPRFEEKLDARRPKKSEVTKNLKRRIVKEKRGVMREYRKDSQYLAQNQLRRVQAEDAMRKKKTQIILNSLRSVQ